MKKPGLENLSERSFTIPDSITKYGVDGLFSGCSELTDIPHNMFSIYTKLTSLRKLFADCTNLQFLPDDFIIPPYVDDVYGMFQGCTKLKILPYRICSTRNSL